MATYLEGKRHLGLKTPLGPDVLLLQGFTGSEGLSQLFHFRLELVAKNGTEVAFDKLLGQKITARLGPPDDVKRHFSGICSRVSQGVRGEFFTHYHVEIVPQLWLLTRIARSRTFQQKSVPDILKQVLTGLDVSYEIEGTFHPRDYCVQYRETDFAFASRLMEEEGIYYFFRHEADGHKMVVANTPQGHPDVPGPAEVEFEVSEAGERSRDGVTSWLKSQEIRSGKYTLWDHCFELPDKNLEADKPTLASVTVGSVDHKLKVGDNDKLEIYDYPGGYAQRFDGISPGGGDRASDVQKIFEDNKRTVGLRMQEEAAAGVVIDGAGQCRRLVAGHKFRLKDHYDGDGSYVLTSIQHSARLDAELRSGESGGFIYENSFTCIPAALPFVPRRATPRPVVHGTQSAVVVGPSGEEIFTDKYGRVKVQFPWDREGKMDADSSCWIRVGSIWAGKNWGAIHIPRIGQEVIVAFEEGDPDRPIIVGSVYNADQMPPYVLPDNKTQSGIKSRSTLQGTPDNYNEIRFEDKKGSEQLLIHAEKDQDIEVENDETHWVGRDRKKTIDNDETTNVKHDRTETVGNNETITVKGARTETVTGNETVSIKQGNRAVTLDMGNDALTIKMGNQTTKLDLGKSSTEALQSIELKVGQSSLVIDQTGVKIKGLMVTVEGTVQTEVKGLMTQVNASAMLMCKGALTMIG